MCLKASVFEIFDELGSKLTWVSLHEESEQKKRLWEHQMDQEELCVGLRKSLCFRSQRNYWYKEKKNKTKKKLCNYLMEENTFSLAGVPVLRKNRFPNIFFWS
jgi:hypothetical protein